MYKLVTFDITGTLLQIKYPIGEIYSKVANTFGLKTNPETLERNFKNVWKEMNIQHPNYGQYTGLGWENWWKQLVYGVISVNRNQNVKAEHVANQLISIFSAEDGWAIKNGSISLLEHLRSCEITIGAISNFDPRLHTILKSLNMYHYFSFVITSYECGYLKPDKEIFQVAETFYNEKHKCNLNKSSVIHIGDSPDIDYIGAAKNGWDYAIVTKDILKLKMMYPEIDESKVFKDLEVLKTCLFT